MRLAIRLKFLIPFVCLLALLMPSSSALSQSVDDLDASTRALLLRCADRALLQWFKDFGLQEAQQATAYLPERLSERAEDIVCIVSVDATAYAFPHRGNKLERVSDIPTDDDFLLIDLGAAYRNVFAPPSSTDVLGVPLPGFVDNPALSALVKNFERAVPVAVSARPEGEATVEPVRIKDPAAIRAAFDALLSITVLREWPVMGRIDGGVTYSFEIADGSVVEGATFQDGMLLHGIGLYEVAGLDALHRALAGVEGGMP